MSPIKLYEKNAKKHPDQQLKLIATSLREYGWRQPIVVDKNDEIIVGHGRYLAYQKFPDGIKEPWVIKADDLTPEQVRGYRLMDNKSNESDWDMALAIEELKDLDKLGFDISLTGFDRDLLITPDEKDDVIPTNVPTRAKLGYVWALGPHRVMCGDSTDKEAVARLMEGKKADMVFTDPPYNTGMKPKDDSSRMSHVFQDAFTEEEYDSLITKSVENCFENTKGEAAFYVCIDWRRGGQIKSIMEKFMPVKNVIVWDKVVHGLGGDYKFTYELIVVGKKGNPKIENRYGQEYQDIWRVQRKIGRNEEHATAKPIELCEKPLKHASKQDDLVLDLFLGSGSTLIAAEKTGRICYGMEIDPKYVDVILKRYEEYTGKTAEKSNG